MFLKECECIEKIKVVRYITDDLGNYSDSDDSDEE